VSFINSFENDVLDAMLGASATLLGANVEIGLSTADPGEDGSGMAEPGSGGYTRVTVANNGTNWGAASGGIKSNLTDIIFPEATGSWGTLSHWALYDTGVMKASGVLDNGSGTPTPVAVAATDVFRFQASELRITLD